jgi:hypothetical protein
MAVGDPAIRKKQSYIEFTILIYLCQILIKFFKYKFVVGIQYILCNIGLTGGDVRESILCFPKSPLKENITYL